MNYKCSKYLFSSGSRGQGTHCNKVICVLYKLLLIKIEKMYVYPQSVFAFMDRRTDPNYCNMVKFGTI